MGDGVSAELYRFSMNGTEGKETVFEIRKKRNGSGRISWDVTRDGIPEACRYDSSVSANNFRKMEQKIRNAYGEGINGFPGTVTALNGAVVRPDSYNL